jgi:hypothetical protein
VHQYFVASWHLFPVWIELFQFISYRLNAMFGRVPHGDIQQYQHPSHSRITESIVHRRVYRLVFAVALTTHTTSLATIASIKLWPFLFSPLIAESVTFQNVFPPPNFRSHTPVRDMVQGALNVLQYDPYVGSSAALVWAFALFYSSCNSRSMSWSQGIALLLETLCVTLIAGPGGAAVVPDRVRG